MLDRSPAQVYALAIGAALVIAGILGFFYSSTFGSPGRIGDLIGILAVNGWRNVFHIATGALGLLAAGYGPARRYALGVGLLYTATAVWGLVLGDGRAIFGIIPMNAGDVVLQAVVGVLGLVAYAVSAAHPVPSRP